MTQVTKKPTIQAAAKLASATATKAAKNTYSAVDSTRASAENVVKIGSTAVKEFLSTSTGEAQKAQEKAYAMSREAAEQVAKSADTATKFLYEAVSISRDNIEAVIETGNITASLAKDLSGEVYDYANKAFTDQVELAREALACRTINDVFELQNKLMKTSIDGFFNQSVKLSGLFFEYTSEALEPLNERVAQATEQFSKALAA